MSETEFWKSTLKQLINKANIYKKYSNENTEKEAYADEIFF